MLNGDFYARDSLLRRIGGESYNLGLVFGRAAIELESRRVCVLLVRYILAYKSAKAQRVVLWRQRARTLP